MKSFKKDYDKSLKQKSDLARDEDNKNLDIIEQFNNLKKQLDVQIHKEQDRRSYAVLGWLLVHSTSLLQSLHNSMAQLSSEKKPQLKTWQKNLGVLRECVSNFREACTLLGLGRSLSNLTFKYYINLLDNKKDMKTKDAWMRQEDERVKLEKRMSKGSIKIHPPLQDEQSDEDKEATQKP